MATSNSHDRVTAHRPQHTSRNSNVSLRQRRKFYVQPQEGNSGNEMYTQENLSDGCLTAPVILFNTHDF